MGQWTESILNCASTYGRASIDLFSSFVAWAESRAKSQRNATVIVSPIIQLSIAQAKRSFIGFATGPKWQGRRASSVLRWHRQRSVSKMDAHCVTYFYCQRKWAGSDKKNEYKWKINNGEAGEERNVGRI